MNLDTLSVGNVGYAGGSIRLVILRVGTVGYV